MFQKAAALLLSLTILMGATACSNGSPTEQQGSSSAESTSSAEAEKIPVSVTFNAMKEFVEAVGKDRVEVATIIPDGTEPHDFEPKAQDLAGLSKAKIFVYNGFGMEAWVEDAIKSANNSSLITVEASKGAEPIQNTEEEEIEEHGQYDPHLWLSLKGAELEVKNIKEALVSADPSNKEFYETNCNDYVAQLEKLYTCLLYTSDAADD